MVNWPGPLPWAAARVTAGPARRSRGRSRLVTTTATAPSLSWQQSSSRSGSAIQREAWWWARVIGLPKNHAFGFVAACRRSATATVPKSALVAPQACMYRLAAIATVAAGVDRPIGECQPLSIPDDVGARAPPAATWPDRRPDPPFSAPQ